MKNFPRIHPELVLIGIAILLLGALAVFYAWGTAILASDIEKAISLPSGAGPAAGFDLAGAKKLNLLIKR